jgi:predicted methyltransferase
VASARASFKGALLRFMPNALLQPLKRVRYLNTVRSFWSPEADVMVAIIEEGDYVLDLGAYVGWYTRVLSQAHLPRGHTERFAPSRISQEVDARARANAGTPALITISMLSRNSSPSAPTVVDTMALP